MAKAKGSKKVNVKDMAKKELNKAIVELFEKAEIDWETGEDYGFTKGTLVVHMENTDVQIKFVTPKAGLDRYEKPKDDDEE